MVPSHDYMLDELMVSTCFSNGLDICIIFRLYSNLAAAYIELADTAGTYQHASRVIDLALVPRASKFAECSLFVHPVFGVNAFVLD